MDATVTRTLVRTQGSKLSILNDTFTPSSVSAIEPTSLVRLMENVGKAIAAKSEGYSSVRGFLAVPSESLAPTFCEFTRESINLVHETLC